MFLFLLVINSKRFRFKSEYVDTYEKFLSSLHFLFLSFNI